ncbi:MAG TPA: histidine phosphatase family protein [Rhabdochlamydiaceae bacterium]|nr:histidine phosphatase family protein [Rhabdochlamydiaceae bacterium]
MSQKTTSPNLYLIRHGATEWSENGRHTGITDLSLTQLGQKQAEQLKQRLAKEKFSKVFSSPLKRALETCKLCGYDPTINSDLKEWNYGQYEGLTTQQICEKNPGWNLFEKGTPGGESPEQIVQRAHHFLHQVHSLEGKIALFSHAHFLRIFATVWLGQAPAFGNELVLSPASISILGTERDDRVIICWNDISHLVIS